jgi:hypothetical protein
MQEVPVDGRMRAAQLRVRTRIDAIIQHNIVGHTETSKLHEAVRSDKNYRASLVPVAQNTRA